MLLCMPGKISGKYSMFKRLNLGTILIMHKYALPRTILLENVAMQYSLDVGFVKSSDLPM